MSLYFPRNLTFFGRDHLPEPFETLSLVRYVVLKFVKSFGL